jgi:hypothetical protein
VGLAQVIIDICKPGTFNEWTHPLIIEVYRMYCWRDTLSMILLRWTHVDVRNNFPTEVSFSFLSWHDYG